METFLYSFSGVIQGYSKVNLTNMIGVKGMSGKWVQDCERLLNQIKQLETIEGKDRLEMVRTIRFILYTLQRSVSGWLEWINNLDIMSTFSLEELREINKKIAELTEAFVEYDVKVTGQYKPIKPKVKRKEELKEKKKPEVFYVK